MGDFRRFWGYFAYFWAFLTVSFFFGPLCPLFDHILCKKKIIIYKELRKNLGNVAQRYLEEFYYGR